MSGIAEVLLNLGYEITGSDLTSNSSTRHLAALGARVMLGHAAENIEKADAIVVSSAIKDDNPEVLAARKKNVPIVPRAVMLAELMRLKRGIAIIQNLIFWKNTARVLMRVSLASKKRFDFLCKRIKELDPYATI